MDRQATDVLNTACSFELLRVHTSDGRFLGHVFDLRCNWRPGQDEGPVVDEIIYGRLGLLERVGLRRRKPDSVPWSAVLRVEGKVIVVDAAPARTPPGRSRADRRRPAPP
ncbi:MAG: PRC-barrel domain-containing protein [Rhizobacter sp.]